MGDNHSNTRPDNGRHVQLGTRLKLATWNCGGERDAALRDRFNASVLILSAWRVSRSRSLPQPMKHCLSRTSPTLPWLSTATPCGLDGATCLNGPDEGGHSLPRGQSHDGL